ncbi:MAG: hypothetical protein HYR81_00570 [Nitrospirae bacterium]|nr:hypothetical protein [Nitrospirota bacterium]
MRHKNIRKKAEFIDKCIDRYLKLRKCKNIPRNKVVQFMGFLFPRGKEIGKGNYKTVFSIPSGDGKRGVVLKISRASKIKEEFKNYKDIKPKKTRNKYFAKIYWKTKYFLLQKEGKEMKVSKPANMEIKNIKKKLKKQAISITDIGQNQSHFYRNIAEFEGGLKIIDFNLSKK